MELNEFGEFAQRMFDMFRNKNSGAQWTSRATKRPKAQQPRSKWGWEFGGPPEVQDRVRDETRLVSGPEASAPRFKRRDNFVVTIWPDPNRPGWYTIGHILESRKKIVKIPRLEYGDHIGRDIVLAQNPDQNARFNPLPG